VRQPGRQLAHAASGPSGPQLLLKRKQFPGFYLQILICRFHFHARAMFRFVGGAQVVG
jgi:hypothetical protein